MAVVALLRAEPGGPVRRYRGPVLALLRRSPYRAPQLRAAAASLRATAAAGVGLVAFSSNPFFSKPPSFFFSYAKGNSESHHPPPLRLAGRGVYGG